jgi:PAS domain S-box-containing protein
MGTLDRAMIDALPAAFIVIDDAGHYLLFNPAAERLLGGRPAPGDSPGSPTYARLFHADGTPMLREDIPLIRGLSGEVTEGAEVLIKNAEYPDGRWLSASAGPLRDELGASIGAVVVLSDVTDQVDTRDRLHRAERMLERSQKMDAVGRLASAVAHDFNDLLTVIHGYAYMLERELDGDVRRDDAAEIRRAAERATALTRQLLLLGRHGAVAPRSLDVGEVVAGFEAVLRRIAGERIEVTIRRAPLPTVIADQGQLEQVVMNLAVNARDAMPDGGKLTVETEALELGPEAGALRGLSAGRYVLLCITDTGVGMDDDTQRRIFEPFFTTKDAARGTGLGLSIVHGIVTAAGGAVSVYSERGHGTTFRVFLPVATRELAPVPGPAPTSPGALPAVRILVVDDDDQVRALANRILRDAGAIVMEAPGAEEARRIFVAADPPIQMVLSDVVLNDWRGDALARQLIALSPTLRVLNMSGYPAGALADTGGPPRRLLAKPFSPPELIAAVAAVLIDGGPTGATELDPEEPAIAAAGPAVLVVDDDDAIRRTIRRILTAAGFAVVEAANGKDAVVALGRGKFEAVVSDLQMPDLDGLGLLRKVRAVDLDLPVILVTGQPDVATAAEAIEHGAFRYLTKPVDAKGLERVVRLATRSYALARVRRDALAASGSSAIAAGDLIGLEVRFDAALEKLWIAFQPIVDARTHTINGVEALMRSDEPSLPGPEQVLDAARALGRLPHLGRRIRRAVAERVAGTTHTVFVNLHPDDLADSDLLDPAAPLSLIAHRVVLEITERASLRGSPALTLRLARLREMGYRIAVDDIGAGYSGLSSFTDLMPELVKIDMSLVRDVHLSPVKRRTIRSLCNLCHEGGVIVVGEGVESPAELACLEELGCDLLQGYLLGRPARDLPA